MTSEIITKTRRPRVAVGVNSGLASKMVLNFPKMDETRRSDKKEKRERESASRLDRCGCCSPSFVPPPDLAQVCLYLKVFGGRQSSAALTKPPGYLGLESASFVPSSSVTTRCGPGVAIG